MLEDQQNLEAVEAPKAADAPSAADLPSSDTSPADVPPQTPAEPPAESSATPIIPPAESPAPPETTPPPAATSQPKADPPKAEAITPTQTAPAQATDQKFTSNMANWKNLLSLALAKKQAKKQDRLNKILALAQSQATITNHQVKKLLRCTQLTAWRYLKLLEKQGKLKRTGGHNTPTYELVK